MVEDLDCPNASQENIKEMIKCKLIGECAYQYPCWIVGGNIFSNGHLICKSRNIVPSQAIKPDPLNIENKKPEKNSVNEFIGNIMKKIRRNQKGSGGTYSKQNK